MTHIYVLLVSLSPKISLRFSLRPALFELQAILRRVHWMPHKWTRTLQHVQDPKYAICVTNIHESQISVLVALRPAALFFFLFYFFFILFFFFWVTDHFGTSGLNAPKWPWILRGHIHPHVYVTSAPESQISLRFCSTAILRKVHRMTPKWP